MSRSRDLRLSSPSLARVIALGASLCTSVVAAETTPADKLDTLVVVAQRRPEPLAQVASSVSLVDRIEIEERMAQTATDLLRYLPGLRMDGDAHRFGAQGVSIRGLGGNRVRVEVDGVPLPDAFSSGQFASAGRDFGEVAAIERIEVLRGPASTLYGSDALAGIVAIRSREAESLLAGADRRNQLQAGYSGRDSGRSLSVLHAGEGKRGAQWLLLGAGREAGRIDNRARSPAAAPNPGNAWQRSFLAKYGAELANDIHWRLVVEHQRGERDTDVVSQRFGAGRFSTTYRLLADDAQQRDRFSLHADGVDLAGFDRIEFALYAQASDVDQRTAQYRLPDRATPFESRRDRRFLFQQDDHGLDLLGQRDWVFRDIEHRFLAGAEWQRSDYHGLRDGVETHLGTGAQSNLILGERFPVRDFPTSVAQRHALFVQDELRRGRLSLIPGLRHERYRLDARPDAMFREDYPDTPTVDVRESSLTGKFGLRWEASANQQLFLQYARGYRAPPFSDLNIGLSLALINYEVRPNPALRPETSRGLETGWRYSGERLRATVSLFRNDYRDLIESRANLGVDPESGAVVFQSVNRDRARIEGVEAEFDWDLAGLGPWLDGFSLHGAAATARGRDTRRDVALNSIDPDRAVLGLRYMSGSGRWGGEGLLTGVHAKRHLDASQGALFAPAGYAVFDAYLWYAPRPNLRLQLGLLNLGDRRYWSWSQVRGLPADTLRLDFHSQPGRSMSLSAVLEW